MKKILILVCIFMGSTFVDTMSLFGQGDIYHLDVSALEQSTRKEVKKIAFQCAEDHGFECFNSDTLRLLLHKTEARLHMLQQCSPRAIFTCDQVGELFTYVSMESYETYMSFHSPFGEVAATTHYLNLFIQSMDMYKDDLTHVDHLKNLHLIHHGLREYHE